LAAFLTPPDPISQVLIAIPLVILYEIAIGVSAIAVSQRTKELRKAFGEE
jgi:sec-independent protein translocase protein TatC